MIHIRHIEVADASGLVRLTVHADKNGMSQDLWFEFSDQYRDWVVSDICDGALLALFPYCVANRIDIVSDVPASRDMLENIEALVSLLVQQNPAEYCAISVRAPVSDKVFASNRRAVLASGSCGVDSMHTLWAAEQAAYPVRPTHLIFNNSGSSLEGSDPEGLLRGRIAKSAAFAQSPEGGYGFIYANSNYSDFVDGMHYSLTHFYVNLAFGFLLANGVGQYLVSSGYEPHKVVFHGDPAHAESILISYVNCTYFRVSHVAGDFCSRFNKVKHLLGYAPAQHHLNVCFGHVDNCGVCGKCRRVLMELECLDAVESFSSVFDLEKYKKERDRVFERLIRDPLEGDPFVDEIWKLFSEKKLQPRHWILAYWMKTRVWVMGFAFTQYLNKVLRHRHG